MKDENKILIRGFVVLLVGFIIVGCDMQQHKESQWKQYKSLKQILPFLEKEKVEKIIFCETDTKNIENWFVKYEVPKSAIDEAVKLMKNSFLEKERTSIWEIYRMKIITNKHKFIIPVRWDDKKIYGIDWTSPELRDFLRQQGFGDGK